jgi:four helix bundle protein
MQRFEDIVAWQLARVLAKDVYVATRGTAFARDFGLAGQAQRAAVSVMANIAEGFERHRPAEFHQYLSTAKASCAELRSHLYVAHDVGYLSLEQFERLKQQAEQVTRVIAGLRSSIERRRHEGSPGTRH